MYVRKVNVINDLGIHARPAGLIAKIAGKAEHTIWLQKESERADASSIMDILGLMCTKGSGLEIINEESDETRSIDEIALLIEKGFDANEC